MPVVVENCEIQLAENAEDCGCGFEAGSTCSRVSQSWYAYAKEIIGDSDREWMADLPYCLVFQHGVQRYAVIQGGTSDVSRFLWSLSFENDFWHEILILQEEIRAFAAVVASHCGIAFERNIDGINWINTSAIGMPCNDGVSGTSYVLLTPDGPQFICLKYDVDGAVVAMEAAGLTQGYHKALNTGYWSSEEILPKAMHHNS